MTSQSEINYNAKNLTLINRFGLNPNRNYVIDYFDILPSLENQPKSIVTLGGSSANKTTLHGKTGILNITTPLRINDSIDFQFKNDFITDESIIHTNIKDVNPTIDASQNYGLSVFTHKQVYGNCLMQLNCSGNEALSTNITNTDFKIGFTIDPHIPHNPNWSVTGTNADYKNINNSQGLLGPGIILSTKNTINDQCIICPRGIHKTSPRLSNATIHETTTVSVNTTTSITIDNGVSDSSDSNATSHWSVGDAVYLSNGSLVGILTELSNTGITFGNTGTLVELPNNTELYTQSTRNSLASKRRFNTSGQIEFECTLRTLRDITKTAFWAGMKESQTGNISSDNNQAYFVFDPTDTLGTLTTNSKLHFMYSISGTDYLSTLPITITKDTIYKLRIVINKDRKLHIYVDSHKDLTSTSLTESNPKISTQYSVTSTEGSTGTDVSSTTSMTSSSLALADVYLSPFIGVQTLDTKASSLVVNYVKISKLITS